MNWCALNRAKKDMAVKALLGEVLCFLLPLIRRDSRRKASMVICIIRHGGLGLLVLWQNRANCRLPIGCQYCCGLCANQTYFGKKLVKRIPVTRSEPSAERRKAMINAFKHNTGFWQQCIRTSPLGFWRSQKGTAPSAWQMQTAYVARLITLTPIPLASRKALEQRQ